MKPGKALCYHRRTVSAEKPDLADLELSCENTDTEIPYIDLVLEILENAVGLPLIVDPVMVATSGAVLLKPGAIRLRLHRLFNARAM